MDKIKLTESYRWCVTKQESVTRLDKSVTGKDVSVGDGALDVQETGQDKTEHIQPIPVRL